MLEKFENILLVSGNGRNVGKTSFVCQVISNLKKNNIIAIKISPHFHKPTQGLKPVSQGDGWIINEETSYQTTKDSSLYLQAGATKSLYIQAEKQKLKTVIPEIKKQIKNNSLVIIESVGLKEFLTPALSVMILPDQDIGQELEAQLQNTDLIVISNGQTFCPRTEIIKFENGWKINPQK